MSRKIKIVYLGSATENISNIDTGLFEGVDLNNQINDFNDCIEFYYSDDSSTWHEVSSSDISKYGIKLVRSSIDRTNGKITLTTNQNSFGTAYNSITLKYCKRTSIQGFITSLPQTSFVGGASLAGDATFDLTKYAIFTDDNGNEGLAKISLIFNDYEIVYSSETMTFANDGTSYCELSVYDNWNSTIYYDQLVCTMSDISFSLDSSSVANPTCWDASTTSINTSPVEAKLVSGTEEKTIASSELSFTHSPEYNYNLSQTYTITASYTYNGVTYQSSFNIVGTPSRIATRSIKIVYSGDATESSSDVTTGIFEGIDLNKQTNGFNSKIAFYSAYGGTGQWSKVESEQLSNYSNGSSPLTIVSIDRDSKTVTFKANLGSFSDGYYDYGTEAYNEITLKYCPYKSASSLANFVESFPQTSFVGGASLSGTASFHANKDVSFVDDNKETAVAKFKEVWNSHNIQYSADKMTFETDGVATCTFTVTDNWGRTIISGTYTCTMSGISLSFDYSAIPNPTYFGDGTTAIDTSLVTNAKLTSGTEEKALSTSELSFSHYPEYDLNSYINYTITASYEYRASVYTSSFEVVGTPNRINFIEAKSADKTSYNERWTAKFKKAVSFLATHVNGDIETIDADDEHLHYYNDADYSVELTENVSVVTETDYIYVRYIDDYGYSLDTKYTIVPTADYVSSIEYSGNKPTLTLGRKASDYTFKIKATYASGYTNDDYTGFSVKNADSYLSGTTSEVDVTFIYPTNGGNAETTIAFNGAYPSMDSVSIYEYGALDQSLNNGKDRFDLTSTILKVTYKDSAGSLAYYSLCPYTKTASYRFTAESNNDEFTPLDGSEKITLPSMTGGQCNVKVTLTAPNEFNADDTKTIEVEVAVLDVSNVYYIRADGATSFKTTYKVGDVFLGNDDTTSIIIGYKDADGNIEEKTMKLSQAVTLLAINPLPLSTFDYTGTYTITIHSIFDSTKQFSYAVNVTANIDYIGETKKLTLIPYKIPRDVQYYVANNDLLFKAGTYILIENKEDNITYSNGVVSLNGSLSRTDSDSDGIKIYGYLKDLGSSDGSTVVLFHDYVPPVSGDSNIIVKFPCYTEGQSDFVDKCHFGTRFGHNNALNRLFLSGNADQPNYDIFSLEPNWNNRLTSDQSSVRETAGDYSYFSDEGMNKYGENDNAIVGYDIVSDSKLLVLKDKAGGERTVYFRSPLSATMLTSSGTTATDMSGNTLTQEEYSTLMSNSPTAGLSPKTIANFNGDTLFVSEEYRVEGLDISGIIGDSQRQANTRSAYIDPEISEQDLTKAILFTAGDYCFLSTDEKLYVAHKDSLSSSTNQYEWWPCDKTNANMFFESPNGDIYFGTEDGSFYRMTQGKYSDTDRLFLSQATGDFSKITVGKDGNVTVSDDIKDLIDSTWKFRVYDSDYPKACIYERICNIGLGLGLQVEGDYLVVKSQSDYAYLQGELIQGQKYYLCQYYNGKPVAGSAMMEHYTAYDPFTIEAVDVGEDENYFAKFKLIDKDGNQVVLSQEASSITFAGFAKKAVGEYSISTISGNKVYLKGDMGATYLGAMNESPSGCEAEFAKYSVVVSEFITSPLFASTANYMKYIYKIDFINATNVPCDLEVGMMPANNSMAYNTPYKAVPFPGANPTFDLDSVDFSNTDFGKNIAPRAYSLRRFFSKKRFFSLALRSKNDKNSVLPGLEITYSYHKLSKGSE